jgi:SAM-dependent methyltransferase
MLDLTQYDTDKGDQYLNAYRTEFGDRFDTATALLELGVFHGGSLYMWRDLLPYAEITGVDINDVELEDDSGRIHFYQGRQQDTALLDRIVSDVAPDGFDVIVDDASHIGSYTAAAFWHLFPRHLKPGGVYVIDDWSTGYWDRWPDGHAHTGSREALGDFSESEPVSPAAATRSLVGNLHSGIRAFARPLIAKLALKERPRFVALNTLLRDASLQHRFPSHDYGMVGFIKQLVDACDIWNIDHGHPDFGPGRIPFDNHIESVHVYASQVFVHKRASG